MRESPVVVALGGNALAPPGQRSSVSVQYERARATAEQLVHLSERPLLVTHGNGPQVGDALLRSDRSAEILPRLPLDACVAGTQGDMGYMLAVCLDNAFRAAAANGPLKDVLTVSDEPLVSVDYIGSLHSSTVDALSTNVVAGTLVNVTSWYDNEMGYSARCVDLLRYVGERL